MSIWSDVLAPFRPRATYSAWDDVWWSPYPSGRDHWPGAISGESALRTSVVWACVNLLSRTQAMLPAIVYRESDDGGKTRNPRHSVAKVLRRRPNAWQTRFEFRQFGMVSILLRGNFYSRMMFDGRGALAELVPLHPDRVTPYQLDNGRMTYTYRPLRGPQVQLTQDEVSHIRGLSLDGIVGVSAIEYGRQTIGRASAQDTANAALYRNSLEARTVITGPKTMSPAARESLKADLAEKTGAMNAGKTLLLEEGFTIEKLSLSPRDAQYVESAYVTIEDICRFFGIPPHMVQHLLRSTNNNIEQQSVEYVVYSLMPYNVAWEAAADRDYFADDDDHKLEFLVDGLLRGDTLSRYQAYALAIANGVMSENEVRIRENLNPWPGLWEPERSVNQGRGGGAQKTALPRAPTPAPAPDQGDGEDTTSGAAEIVRRSAARMVRSEVAAIRAAVARQNLSREWVAAFYARHAEALVDALCLDPMQARQYGADHCALILERGLSVMDIWPSSAVDRLVALALTPKENGHHA